VRVVRPQADEWSELRVRHPDAALCVAGDFNMHLGGRVVRDEGKKGLYAGLSAAGLACVTLTEHIPTGKLSRRHIDHVCVPEAWAERTTVVDGWPGTMNDVRLSDHSAVVIEIGG
jgi:endonuclease/exonuclease/phosphatase family metal-dependent hydrolase